MIELTTLGGVSVRRNGEELGGLSTHKQKFALLVYLAIEGPVARDRLLAVFWPEREEEKARHSLSQALYALKRELNDDYIRASGDQVSLAEEAVRIDAKLMEAAADEERWESVIELYAGPFLDQFNVPGAREFEDWQSRTRTRLARLARRGLARIAEARAAADDQQGALAVATRWAALEPLEDEAQHTLIALLARMGQRSQALKHFEAYRDRLARELEVEPLEETVALVEQIKAGGMPEYRPLAGSERRGEVPEVRELPTGDYFKTQASAAARGRKRSAAAAERGAVSLLEELRKRRVVHVGAAYLAVSWLALDASATFIERGVLQEWIFPALVFFLVVGFPFALILAWAQEQQVLESPRTETIPTGPWPRWFEKVRGGHVLAFLSALVLALLAVVFVLGRDIFRPPPTIVAAATLEPTRVAVLHFDDLSEEQDLTPLCAGFTKSLIHDLSQVKALDVIPFSGVKRYRDATLTLDSIARALTAGTLVEASVSESEGRLHVSVQLINAASSTIIASKEFERPHVELLELRSDLAHEVSGFLREQLGVEIRLRRGLAATQSVEAWELVQEAEELREDAETLAAAGDTSAAADALDHADALLARAEKLDANWVEPIVRRGWVAADRAERFQVSPRTYDLDWTRLGIDHAERALDRKPNDAAALELRGTLQYYLWETEPGQSPDLRGAAEQDLQAAVSADPSRAFAWFWLSEVLRLDGRFAEARIAARKANEADAFLEVGEVPVLFRVCQMALELEDFEEAIPCFDELNRRYPANAGFANAQLVLLASSVGPDADAERAWQLFEQLELALGPQKWPGFQPIILMTVAAVLARAGLEDSAKAVIRQANQADTNNDPYVDYFEANARLQLGDKEKALDLLVEHLEATPHRKAYIAKDWWWRLLRPDPRFKALVAADK